jgi:hypothetical protein
MAGSLISYFCTMVAACTVLMAVMNHFPTSPTFRQPHPGVVFKHRRVAIEPDKPSGPQLLGAGQPSAKVAEAAPQELQKEKQALGRSGGTSPKRRVGRRRDNPEVVASSLLGQYRDPRATEMGRYRSAARVGQCDWCAPTTQNY